MANRDYFLLVAVATILSSLLLPEETVGLEHNISNSSPHGRNNINLQDILKDSSKIWQQEWLIKSATPSYLKGFFELAEEAYNKSSTFETRQQDAFKAFIEKLLYGVDNVSCKGHVTEWFSRRQTPARLLGEDDKWVLQMLDSWGKLPEGILSGHVNSFGDFHECVQIKVTELEILNNIYPEKSIKKSFEGQYCTSYLVPYDAALNATPHPPVRDPARAEITGIENGIQESLSVEEFLELLFGQVPSTIMMLPSVSICLPNSCSLPEVQQILVNGMNMVYAPPLNPARFPWPVTTSCIDDNKPELDTAAIVVMYDNKMLRVLLAFLVTIALVAGILDYWYTHSGENTAPPSAMAFKYLMAFSLYTNTKKFLSTRKSPDDLGCLHGIRFLSTAWVVLAHTYVMFISGPQWNMIDMRNVHKDWTVLAVINGTFSVDTFFVMSGMLATYNILKMLDKTKGKFNVIMFYVHRYIRLTPTYAILVGIAATLLSYTGNGPLWAAMQTAEENCRNNWWTNILYVNNLVNSNEMCNGESWYLANDMQFYILAPLIVYPIWKWKLVGMVLLAVYTILSCISQVLVVRYAKGAPPAMVLTGDMTNALSFNEIYFRPWSRIAPFLVGTWLGWLLHVTRGKRVNLSRPLVAVLWLCSTGIALADLFAVHSWFNPANQIPEVAGYFYAGLSRASWGVVISWIIFACVKGYGGIVNKFLSWKLFMPLGRLCFCVYLTSIHIQSIFHSRLAVPIKWDTYTVVNLFFAHMVMSYMVGFFCTLLFESPFITLQKLIFERDDASQKPKKLTNSSDTSTDVEIDIPNNEGLEKIVKINKD